MIYSTQNFISIDILINLSKIDFLWILLFPCSSTKMKKKSSILDDKSNLMETTVYLAFVYTKINNHKSVLFNSFWWMLSMFGLLFFYVEFSKEAVQKQDFVLFFSWWLMLQQYFLSHRKIKKINKRRKHLCIVAIVVMFIAILYFTLSNSLQLSKRSNLTRRHIVFNHFWMLN